VTSFTDATRSQRDSVNYDRPNDPFRRRVFDCVARLIQLRTTHSDFATPIPFDPRSHYEVPNWPATPPGRHWREITQARDVPQTWAGREPLFPWEAKVYVFV
jgi:pullulanase